MRCTDKLTLQLANFLLESLGIIDVDRHTIPACDTTLVVTMRIRTCLTPTIDAIGPQVARLDSVRLAARQGAGPNLGRRLLITGMKGFRPIEVPPVRVLQAKELLKSLIIKGLLALTICAPNFDRNGIDEQSKPFRALA